jgi:hypothetical protein
MMAPAKRSLIAAILAIVTLLSVTVESIPIISNATATAKSPCAQVSQHVVRQNATQVHAELAYKCLTSVPLHVEEAKELHRSLVPYLKWQTTLSYVKNPPMGYQMPAFDFWKAFHEIGIKLGNGSYESEWEYGMDLYKTFLKVHDGHFIFVLDVVGKAFTFGRDVPLVSVSRDGQSLPEVYVHGKSK